MSISRRTFLGGLTAGMAATALPFRGALAAGGDLRFLFVFNPGGWDPTTVFAPVFDNPNVAMDPSSELGNYGGIDLVESLTRPSVSAYFNAHHGSTVLLNGVSVRSLSHEICTLKMLTGTNREGAADWGARLGDGQRSAYSLPHLVLGGPSLPGDFGRSVARSGATGQLDGLLGGSILEQSEAFAGRPSAASERIMDRFLARRSAARAGEATEAADAALATSFAEAASRAEELKGLRFDMDFQPGQTLASQGEAAVEALERGISRCVSLATPGTWDTHANNNQNQSALFEGLFSGLLDIQQRLRAAPGHTTASLADETVVVVLSEMGRTPRLNAGQGKDHWPYTSVMLTGPGLTGSRVVGGWDERYYGRGVAASTGDVSDEAPLISTEVLGATLLALADQDPAEVLPGAEPLIGILS
jgi:hypothetical protein